MFERNTNISSSVLSILQNTKQPLSVKQIIKNLQEISISANKTTIYRIIKKLIDKKEITEIVINSGIKYYELTSKKHDHLICNECHAIFCINVKNVLPSSKMKRLPSGKTFKMKTHQLNIYGVCESCEDTSN
tara:strand:+ start:38 stop:433 length:396 start_codon:yes stop_codon:yes gene_type:complete